jgi:hypothetical protein
MCLALCPLVGARAQGTLDELHGAQAGDGFGSALAELGDLNQDGTPDFAVGAPGADVAGAESGTVSVFSGADRSLLHQWHGSQAGARFGHALDNAGDVDRDGVDDLIVGAPGASQAQVFSGQSGALLFDMAPASGAEFGSSVAGLGFVDGDAWPDFAVGASAGTGLWVFSGRNGGLHWNSTMAAPKLAGLGDVDGDGQGDLIIGDPSYGWFYGGRAVVISGFTGAVIYTHLGDNNFSEMLGFSVAGLGDLDGDGLGEYAYGVPCQCFASHFVNVHSGATGALLHHLSEYTFGWSLAAAGDLDLDGVPEIMVAEPGPLYIYSGATGDKLHEFGNGEVLSGGGDLNGDGLAEVLIGAPGDDSTGTDAGRVTLYSPPCLAPAPDNYCNAAANSTGAAARMGYQGTTSISQNNLRLFAQDCPTNQFGIFFHGTGQQQTPLGDGFLCVTPPILRLPVVSTGASGTPSWAFDLNSIPGSSNAGDTRYFSFWFRDPPGGGGGTAGNNLTDGLKVTLCP